MDASRRGAARWTRRPSRANRSRSRSETGNEVFAGTINGGGALVVEVTRRADESVLARIIRLVEEARERRAPAQHFIDRFAHPYTLGVVAVTALVAAAPGAAPGRRLERRILSRHHPPGGGQPVRPRHLDALGHPVRYR
jgi:magnesium-transporting ATPase (P-type)